MFDEAPIQMSSKGKYYLDIIHLWNKRKYFSVVHAFLVRNSLDDHVSLVMFKKTIGGKIGLIDPYTLHEMRSLQSRNKFPRLILLQGINFSSHGSFSFYYSLSINMLVFQHLSQHYVKIFSLRRDKRHKDFRRGNHKWRKPLNFL